MKVFILTKTRIVRESDYSLTSALFILLRPSVHKNPNPLQSRAITLLQICEKLQVAILT